MVPGWCHAVWVCQCGRVRESVCVGHGNFADVACQCVTVL